MPHLTRRELHWIFALLHFTPKPPWCTWCALCFQTKGGREVGAARRGSTARARRLDATVMRAACWYVVLTPRCGVSPFTRLWWASNRRAILFPRDVGSVGLPTLATRSTASSFGSLLTQQTPQNIPYGLITIYLGLNSVLRPKGAPFVVFTDACWWCSAHECSGDTDSRGQASNVRNDVLF